MLHLPQNLIELPCNHEGRPCQCKKVLRKVLDKYTPRKTPAPDIVIPPLRVENTRPKPTLRTHRPTTSSDPQRQRIARSIPQPTPDSHISKKPNDTTWHNQPTCSTFLTTSSSRLHAIRSTKIAVAVVKVIKNTFRDSWMQWRLNRRMQVLTAWWRKPKKIMTGILTRPCQQRGHQASWHYLRK